RARIVQGDLFAALPEPVRYNVIVANPPYVPLTHGRQLAPDVVDHEPHLALFAGEDGLEVVRQVIAGLQNWLAPGGFFATEIDPSPGAAVCALWSASGPYGGRGHGDLARPGP